MYLVRMPGESYRSRFRSLLLCSCYVFRTLINSLVWRLAESNPDVELLTQQTYGISPKVPARDLQMESECTQRTGGSVTKRDVYPGRYL